MWFVWSCLAHGAPQSVPPDPALTRAFLDWHCSDDNVTRYDSGDLVLAEAPEGVRSDDAPLHPVVEVRHDGLPASGRNFASIAVAADTPAAQVVFAFTRLAHRLDADAVKGVLLARPGSFAPRPPPPYGQDVLTRIRDAQAQIARDPASLALVSARTYQAAGRCREVVDQMSAGSCVDAVDLLAAALADRKCRMDAPEMLAMFAVTWGRGEGQPVVRVPVKVRGAAGPPQEGTWASIAAELASGDLAMVGGVVGGVELVEVGGGGSVEGGVLGGALGTTRVFHHSELEVMKRMVVPYPQEARDLQLGDQRCLVKVFISRDGTPTDAIVEKCPTVFHGPVRDAVLQWRWYPPKDGRNAVDAQTTIAVTMKPG
jgi:hypothetical protein